MVDRHTGVRSTPPRTPSEVAYEGRVVQLLNSRLVLATLLGVSFVVLAGVAAQGQLDAASRLVGLVLLVVVAQLTCTGLRHLAQRADRSQACNTEQLPDPDDELRPEFVIACSGGGIKSSSFCLGVLQRLEQEGLYRRAHTVVGVSGGGYMAAAFAALSASRARRRVRGATDRTPGAETDGAPSGGEPLFAPCSPELDQLRARSNYLLASTRVRFNLAASVVTGVVIHLVILAAICHVAAWVVAEHTYLTQPEGAFTWTQRAVWMVPAALIMIAILVFLFGRGVEPTRRAPLRRSLMDRFIPAGRRGYSVAWYVSSLPGFLVYGAFAHVVLFSVVPWTVSWARASSWSEGIGVFGGWGAAAASVIAGIGAVQAFAASTVKGVRAVTDGPAEAKGKSAPKSGPPPWYWPLLARFRKRAAPSLGLIALALVLFLDVTLMVAIGQSIRQSGSLLPTIVVSPLPALLMLAGLRFLVHPAHATSLVPFYEDRLSYAYLEAGVDDVSEADKLALAPNRSSVSLTDLTPTHQDAVPHLRLCATANVQDAHLLPAGRNATPFVYGDEWVGLTDGRLPGGQALLKPEEYGNHENVTLARAIAVSSAAISPLAGRENHLIGPARILLALANIRLGVWVRNPYWVLARADRRGPGRRGLVDRLVEGGNHLLDRSSPLHVLHEALGVPSVYAPYLYLTDGGHHDNLGLVEALRLRPHCLVLIDGSGDEEDSFSAMSRAMVTARMDLGVEVNFVPGDLYRGSEPVAEASLAIVTATHPGGLITRIVYVKSVWTAAPSWDVHCYRHGHPGFPSVSNELETYDEFDFEAYRQLGWTYGTAALPAITCELAKLPFSQPGHVEAQTSP